MNLESLKMDGFECTLTKPRAMKLRMTIPAECAVMSIVAILLKATIGSSRIARRAGKQHAEMYSIWHRLQQECVGYADDPLLAPILIAIDRSHR